MLIGTRYAAIRRVLKNESVGVIAVAACAVPDLSGGVLLRLSLYRTLTGAGSRLVALGWNRQRCVGVAIATLIRQVT